MGPGTGRADWDAAVAELARAGTFALGGVGFAGQVLPVTQAFRTLQAAGAGVRTAVEELLGSATPAGKVYAATLLTRLDLAAGRAAWHFLAGDPGEVQQFSGCIMSSTTLAEFARGELAALDRAVPQRPPEAAHRPPRRTPVPPYPYPPAPPVAGR